MDVVCKIDWDSHTRALARSRRGRGHKATAVRSPHLMRGDRTPGPGLLPLMASKSKELNLIVAQLIERFATIHGRRPKSKKELGIRRIDPSSIRGFTSVATSYTGCSSFRDVSHVSTIAQVNDHGA
jgi:hypothetical protein